MVRSFLNVFLPNDEYKRMRILYFLAETTFITVVALLIFGLMNAVLSVWNMDATLIVMYLPFLMMAYTYFRYIFSGIEFTEVADQRSYKKRVRSIGVRTIIFGIVFSVIYFIPIGPREEGWDAVILLGLVVIFYFLFDYISLKRSYKKNKDLK